MDKESLVRECMCSSLCEELSSNPGMRELGHSLHNMAQMDCLPGFIQLYGVLLPNCSPLENNYITTLSAF